MSLLLQALKKAEEDKRRRAALLAKSDLESGAEPLAVEFPTLNLIEEDGLVASIESADSSAVSAAQEWDFTAPEAEIASVQAEVIADAAPQGMSIEPETEADLAPTDEPVVALPEAPPAVPVSPDLTVAQAAAPLVTPSSEPAQQRLAKSLFAKSAAPPGRGLLPWLALSAGLLLAGMLAWFTWQYQQFTQLTSNIAPVSPIAASEPVSAPVNSDGGYTAERAADQDLALNTPVDPITAAVPEKPAASSAPTPQVNVLLPAARGGAASHELAPKFIRQAANLSAPEPLLLAWQAYQNGDLTQAERLYRKVLLTDARQRDALLGLAAIAQQRGDLAEADSLYRRLLRFNPQDESAKAALLGLNSAQMPEKDAVQLEQSGKADPLVLGHYFAAQQRWGQAQEQFFLAYTANPNSADAALNLAVSLDHLKQTSLAHGYYRKALQAKEQINFDRSKVEQRLLELDTAAEQKP